MNQTGTDMKRISFNSVVPSRTFSPGAAIHYLALRQLKSYLIHKGLDSYFEILFNLFEFHLPDPEIVERLITQDADVAAFSVYPWNVENIKGICRILKATKRETFIVLGGPYVSFTAEAWMQDGDADLVVIGEGEDVFYRVADNIRKGDDDFRHIPNILFRQNGETVRTPIDHSFDVSLQDHPLLVQDGVSETFLYETSRGCPFQCRFCTWDVSRKRQIRFYPRKKIATDLEAIFGISFVKHLFLCDSDLFLNKAHGLWVLRLIHRLNAGRRDRELPEITLAFETNPEHVDDEIIDEIERLPLRGNIISCGLQTVDEHVSRYHLNRVFDREKYLTNLRWMNERLKKYNNYQTIEIIYGLPGETYEGFKNTVDVVVSDMPLKFIMFYPFLVLPGSFFWDHAEAYALVFEEAPPHYLISSSSFSREDMEKAKKLAFFIQLFSSFLKGISRVVEKNVEKNRLGVYECIICHLEKRYPKFVAHLYGLFRDRVDSTNIWLFSDHMRDKKFLSMRYDMIRDARDIVRGYAQQGSGNP